MPLQNYTPGMYPGQVQFALDGDFTQFTPWGPPKISFPLKGDSVFSNNDVLYSTGTDYQPVPLGTYPNLQPWSNNQLAAILEQDFTVAMQDYTPLPLNTPYQAGVWDIGWEGILSNGQPIAQLANFYLVEVGETEDLGQGIIRVRLKFATIPPTRNEVESFTYTFPGLSAGRQPITLTVQSRIQYDYFIFDDFDILSIPLFPAGHRLDGTTGLYPAGLILQPQFYYAPVANAIGQNIFLDQPVVLSDADGMGNPGSVPSNSEWLNWIQGIGTSNGTPPELIAEASSMRRWQGNIWERRTRFLQVL